ncbi:MAG: hypothetical protein SVK08_01585 [Halobacteriota archaeon]|nr:hypothetical protein [Halobacteriota archaeon]
MVEKGDRIVLAGNHSWKGHSGTVLSSHRAMGGDMYKVKLDKPGIVISAKPGHIMKEED